MSSMNENGLLKSDRPFRVLAIDGGGVRGLYTATLLATLAQRVARERGVNALDLGRSFDLITGTSTGGILACGLAAGLSADALADLYRNVCPKVFSDPLPTGRLKKLAWSFRNWRRAANPVEPLREALVDVLGDETLEQVYGRRGIGLCVPTVNIVTQQGVVFKTPHHGQIKQRDNERTLVDVCLATSAAPFFLPAARLPEPGGAEPFFFVDGGLWANNPTGIALVEAQAIAPPGRPIEIVSVGTSGLPAGLATVEGDTGWGISFWQSGRLTLTTAMACQSHATANTANLLIPHLKKPTTILRLPSTPPSAEQAHHLALDRATRKALAVLEALGKRDADVIVSAIHAGRPAEMQMLQSLLDEAEPLQPFDATP